MTFWLLAGAHCRSVGAVTGVAIYRFLIELTLEYRQKAEEIGAVCLVVGVYSIVIRGGTFHA
jgi:high-affinity Fe2+/Pb2+ permease